MSDIGSAGQAAGLAPGGETLTRWGRRSVGKIPQIGKLIPSANGDGVFTGREPSKRVPLSQSS